MDIHVSSNKSSPLLQNLEKVAKTDMYAYSLAKNTVNSSLTCVQVSPNVAAAANPVSTSIAFRIPSYGLVSQMILQTTLTTAGDNSAVDNNNLGERVFSLVSLRSHNKEICSQTPQYCHVRGQTAPTTKGLTHGAMVNSATSFNATSVTVQTPLYFPFFEKTNMTLDSNFLETLELSCDINSLAGMGLGQAITASDFKLFVWYRSLENEAYESYLKNQFPENSPLVQLIYDQYTETKAITDNDTSNTLDIKHNGCVFASHIFVEDSSTTLGSDSAITHVTVSAAGRNLINNIPADILNHRNAAFADSNLQLTKSSGAVVYKPTVKPLSIYWGESPDRTYNSGALSLSGLNNPQITVSHADLGATKRLVVVHEYFKLVTVSPNSGIVDVGLTN